MSLNFRDHNDKTVFLKFTIGVKMNHFNNKERIAEMESELRREGITFDAHYNPTTDGYYLEGKVSNRFGLIFNKLLRFLGSLI